MKSFEDELNQKACQGCLILEAKDRKLKGEIPCPKWIKLDDVLRLLRVRTEKILEIFDKDIRMCEMMLERLRMNMKKLDIEKDIVPLARLVREVEVFHALQSLAIEKKKEVLAELTTSSSEAIK